MSGIDRRAGNPSDGTWIRRRTAAVLRHTGRAIVAGLVAVAVAAGGWLIGTGGSALAKGPSPCRDVTHEGALYTVCTIDLATHEIALRWRAPGGEPYGSLGTFARSETRAGRPPLIAMNAGMYHSDGRPVGLYVEGGQELARLVTRRGPGNFHMLPNGVFYITATGAGVLESRRYQQTKPPAVYATQSGPMLVIDGQLHPRFTADGPSQKIRNGVGVKDARTVVFAISSDGVSFGAFARLFRDKFGCANALYLDGSISSLWAPSAGRTDELWPVGPILAVTPRATKK